jgi:hypothetical protein
MRTAPQRVKVEQLAHQRQVVGHRVDDLDLHAGQRWLPNRAEIDIGRVGAVGSVIAACGRRSRR